MTSIKVVQERAFEPIPQEVRDVKTETGNDGAHWQKMLVGLIPPHNYFVITYPTTKKVLTTYYDGGTLDLTTGIYTGGAQTGEVGEIYQDDAHEILLQAGRVS